MYVEKNTSNATARPKGRPTPLSRPGYTILNTLLEKCIAYGISKLMMKHHEKARLLQDEYQALTGVRPVYPRSSAALQRLSETLEHAKALKERLIAGRAEEEIEREFTRLGRINESTFWTTGITEETERDDYYADYDTDNTLHILAVLNPVVNGKMQQKLTSRGD